jgi:FAD/FMN-containing dehydrogenase
VRVASYAEIQGTLNPAAPVAHFQTNLFLPKLGDATISAVAQAIDHAPLNARAFMVPYYGAMTRVGVKDTAFPLREVGFEMDLMARWTSPAERPGGEAWVRALREALKPYAHGAYVNQLGETSEELVRQAYGVNYARLVKLKRKYDPGNLFRSNQNVKPG